MTNIEFEIMNHNALQLNTAISHTSLSFVEISSEISKVVSRMKFQLWNFMTIKTDYSHVNVTSLIKVLLF